ncbi:unnamed protein product [Moneuplotes crassus]|uniref:Uncharacterized protein n=1 Tax=Euplotes crassus TaxID=5936 RepID=A0AAD1XKT8_EUPCR|nr:unnamed protein product [Moneuplotes crassus]
MQSRVSQIHSLQSSLVKHRRRLHRLKSCLAKLRLNETSLVITKISELLKIYQEVKKKHSFYRSASNTKSLKLSLLQNLNLRFTAQDRANISQLQQKIESIVNSLKQPFLKHYIKTYTERRANNLV